MSWLHNYIISLTAAAILCAAVQELTRKTAQRGVISLFCGIFLLTVMITPLKSGIPALRKNLSFIKTQSSQIVQEQIHSSDALTREYTASQAAAFLEAQGEALTGAEWSVEIALDDSLFPVSASVTAPVQFRDSLVNLTAKTLGLSADRICFDSAESPENVISGKGADLSDESSESEKALGIIEKESA